MTPDERLDALVAARLATAAKATRGEVAKAILRFAPDPREWDARVAASIERVTAAGADAGTVWSRFGSKSAVKWKRLVERAIPGLALGIDPGDAKAHGRLGDRDAWAAAIVARAHRLWNDGPPPTPAAVCDELVWRGLGLAGKAKRTPPEIRALFVDRELGSTVERGAYERSLRVLAAHLVGAPRSDLRALRDALGRRWLAADDAWRGATTPARSPARATAGNGELVVLASAVNRAANDATDGVFGDRKVFIASVWRSLVGRPPVERMDLDAFKRRLVEAHRAGLVSLVRADLVGVMDPEQVAASEAASGEARFHFVVREVSP